MKKELATLILFVFLAACTDRAAELYDTAQFEELQNNREHAVKLYREIVEKYPDAPQAKAAAERLAELQR